jgi:hypothetical protein
MTYVVTANCIQSRHTKRVEICPAVASYLGPNCIVIDKTIMRAASSAHQNVAEDAIYPQNSLSTT